MPDIPEPKHISVIIPSAGDANRMEGINKQLYLLGDLPVVEHSVRAFLEVPTVAEIIVICRKQELALYQELLTKYQKNIPCKAVIGGTTRQESVFAGVQATMPEATHYAIHDGARPMIQPQEIIECIALASKHHAAAAGVPVKDTIKITSEAGQILTTPPRDHTYAIQTPQIVEATLYKRAMAEAQRTKKSYTDDCQLVEQLGVPVYISEGSYENIKITTPDDIPLVEGLFFGRHTKEKQSMRIGHGYDVHQLAEGRKLLLAGVDIPYTKGLVGHSDADIAAHVVMDCILGALALGDIGRHFPDTDPAYKDANSIELLRLCVELMQAKGYHVQNIDVTLLAQEPKLAPYIPLMCKNLATVLCCELDQVNVKATTEEKLGFTGAKQGIAAHAVCLLTNQPTEK